MWQPSTKRGSDVYTHIQNYIIVQSHTYIHTIGHLRKNKITLVAVSKRDHVYIHLQSYNDTTTYTITRSLLQDQLTTEIQNHTHIITKITQSHT